MPERGHWPMRFLLLVGVLLMLGGVGTQLYAYLESGLRPEENSYGAMVYTFISLQGFFAVVLAIMGFYTIARSLAGKLNSVRRATFDNTALFWHYTTGQGLVALGLLTFFPRAVA